MTIATSAMTGGRGWLALGGWLSIAASLLHVACIWGGPDWYRFFGAGEPIARAAERGSPIPAVMAIGIAAILLIWAAYAFSGAGWMKRLPLLRTGLVVIATIYLLRGLFVFVPDAMQRPDLSPAFLFWSSAIVLGYGLVFAIGTWKAWPSLAIKERY